MPPFFLADACTRLMSTGPPSMPRLSALWTGSWHPSKTPGNSRACGGIAAGPVSAGDLEGVRDTAWSAGDAAGADGVVFSVEVHEDLALERPDPARRSLSLPARHRRAPFVGARCRFSS